MAAQEVHQLNIGPLTAHAFNKDRTRKLVQGSFICSKFSINKTLGELMLAVYFFCFRIEVAICPNNNEVQIYQKTGNSWNLLHSLFEVCKFTWRGQEGFGRVVGIGAILRYEWF